MRSYLDEGPCEMCEESHRDLASFSEELERASDEIAWLNNRIRAIRARCVSEGWAAFRLYLEAMSDDCPGWLQKQLTAGARGELAQQVIEMIDRRGEE